MINNGAPQCDTSAALAAAFHASMYAGGGAQAARSFHANRVTFGVAA